MLTRPRPGKHHAPALAALIASHRENTKQQHEKGAMTAAERQRRRRKRMRREKKAAEKAAYLDALHRERAARLDGWEERQQNAWAQQRMAEAA